MDPDLLGRLEDTLRERKPTGRSLPDGFTRAGVLVPLIEHPDQVSVSLMRRTDAGGPHSGQISFPGGRPEPADADLAETALRESEEEFGIKPETVRLIGQLDDEITITGYVVSPVVGRIQGPIDYRPDPEEVTEIFEVPLSFFIDPENEQEKTPVTWKGREYTLYQYDFEGRIIWGLTARILHCLMDLLRELTPVDETRGGECHSGTKSNKRASF
jgi:8-oxo-dGTP pyrophosphatase MutT (NUDIX family)